jgi:hypothetical protein
VTSHSTYDEADQSADHTEANSTQQGGTGRLRLEAAILARRARCQEEDCSACGAAQEADGSSLKRTEYVTSHPNFADIAARHSHFASWVW